MNKLMLSVLIIAMLASTGCTRYRQYAIPKPLTIEGEIALGQVNYGPMAQVQQQLEQAQQAGDDAPTYYENILQHYASREGDFERAVLTALSMEYLRQGKLDDFRSSCMRLQYAMNPDVMVTPAMQYVLELGQAMHVSEGYVGRNYDPKMRRIIGDILQ